MTQAVEANAFIAAGGAVIADEGGRTIDRRPMDRLTVGKVVQLLTLQGISALIYPGDKTSRVGDGPEIRAKARLTSKNADVPSWGVFPSVVGDPVGDAC